MFLVFAIEAQGKCVPSNFVVLHECHSVWCV